MTNLSNEPDKQRYQSYREPSDQQAKLSTRSATSKLESFKYREPCQEPKGRDESDLCAQWRAAKAGEDSALWAKWSVWIGALGLVGLFVSLGYTRAALKSATDAAGDAERALNIAERNAIAVARQTEISEDTARRTLRAYFHLRHIQVSDITTGVFRVAFTAINYGITPASRVRHYCAIDIVKTDAEIQLSNPELSEGVGDAPIAKGEKFYADALPFGVLDAESTYHVFQIFNQLNAGITIMHIRGWFEYQDIFDEPHRTDYHVCLGGRLGGAELQESEGVEGRYFSPWYWQTGNNVT